MPFMIYSAARSRSITPSPRVSSNMKAMNGSVPMFYLSSSCTLRYDLLKRTPVMRGGSPSPNGAMISITLALISIIESASSTL